MSSQSGAGPTRPGASDGSGSAGGLGKEPFQTPHRILIRPARPRTAEAVPPVGRPREDANERPAWRQGSRWGPGRPGLRHVWHHPSAGAFFRAARALEESSASRYMSACCRWRTRRSTSAGSSPGSPPRPGGGTWPWRSSRLDDPAGILAGHHVGSELGGRRRGPRSGSCGGQDAPSPAPKPRLEGLPDGRRCCCVLPCSAFCRVLGWRLDFEPQGSIGASRPRAASPPYPPGRRPAAFTQVCRAGS